jgi:hypothetical protein
MGELFAAEIAAMRNRSSTAEVLALYDRGLKTCGEVLSAAWQACYDRPELQAELIRQFRAHPSEFIPSLVGDGLADLAAQSAVRRAAGGGGAPAERVAVPDRPRD